MKKCEYCGQECGDEAANCVGCGTEFPVPKVWVSKTGPERYVPFYEPFVIQLKRIFLLLCGVYQQGFVRRAPVFGSASVSAPVVGFAGAWMLCSTANFGPGDSAGLGAFIVFVAILLLALHAGALLAFASLLRGEKLRALGLIGLTVNLVPVIYVYTVIMLHKS